MRRILILFLFFLTGASGLIYQVAWVRQSTLVFGVSIYAYSAVLAAFMGGLALGSYALRGVADRAHAPLRLFALLQLAIAGLGIASPFVLTGLMPFYASLARELPGGAVGLNTLRAILSICVLILPTFLMGGALPVMARGVAASAGRVGSDVGQLYAADTLGAAIGCAVAGLFLLRTLGTRETIYFAAILNLSAAAGAWALSRRAASREIAVAPPVAATPAKRASRSVRPTALTAVSPRPAAILVAYAVSGFAALGYEVVWARILTVFTLDAVYSFAIMLATLLFGLTAGGWLGAWWARRRRMQARDFGLVQIGVALSAMLTLFIFAVLPSITLEDVFGSYSVAHAIYYEFLLGFVSLLAPAVLLGLLFPIAVSLYSQERTEHVAKQVGVVNASNTLGAIIGSLITGFVLVPWLGLQTTAVELALLNLGIGIAVFYLYRLQIARWWPVPATGAALFALGVIALPSHYYLGFRQGPSDRMVFYAEGPETTVVVFDVPEQNFKVSFVNGRIEVPTDAISMAAFRLLGHLPAILRPDAGSALMMSFGNGIATGSLDTYGIERIDAVDLSAEQFEAAEIDRQENHNVLHSPRLHPHVEDARNFLLQTSEQYDIITTDATHPSNASSWALFTEEFYRQVAGHLAPDGVFMQWLPFHSLAEHDYKSILRTFQSVFPHATLWYTGGSHTLLLATPERLTADELQERLQAAANNAIIADELGSPAQIAAYLAMDEDALAAYAGEGPLVTDDDAFFLPYAEETELIRQAMLQAQTQTTP